MSLKIKQLAGIYVHIPFCKKACSYCNFHFTVSLKDKTALIKAIQKELTDRKDFLEQEEIESIYFGGGTPSILSLNEIEALIKTIDQNYKIKNNAEICLEANPDDIDEVKLKGWKETGINRLSLGIQSFNDKELQILGRVHTAAEAVKIVEMIRKADFDSFSIDLIYGIPGSDKATWLSNLERAIEFNIPHFSAYALTREEKTIFDFNVRKGRQSDVDDAQIREQFLALKAYAKSNSYIHYEISNFSKAGFFSFHNSNYWKNKKYLGAGPSAHSFDLQQRRWNVSINKDYIEGVGQGKTYYEIEILSDEDKFNEYLMLGLRTIWGVKLSKLYRISSRFRQDVFEGKLNFYMQNGFIRKEEDIILLTDEGILFSDRIISELFIE